MVDVLGAIIAVEDNLDELRGPQGPEGKAGALGPQGFPGDRGADGQDGKAGLDGPPGLDGAPGRDGQDGADGEGISWRGPWKPGTYDAQDAVELDGSSYIARARTRAKPPGGAWDLMAKKGADGGTVFRPSLTGGGGSSSSGSGLPAGGTLGQALIKQSATNGDALFADEVIWSETDPGAVGAGRLWGRLDTVGILGDQGPARGLFIRNAANDGWLQAGVLFYDTNNILRFAIHHQHDSADPQGNFEFATYDSAGTMASAWRPDAAGDVLQLGFLVNGHFDWGVEQGHPTAANMRWAVEQNTGAAVLYVGGLTIYSGDFDPNGVQPSSAGDLFKYNSGNILYINTSVAFGTVWTNITALGLSGSAQTYTESNVTTDRTFNANATSIDELADVLGTLIADLRSRGIVA